jgi:hypothetical protein
MRTSVLWKGISIPGLDFPDQLLLRLVKSVASIEDKAVVVIAA